MKKFMERLTRPDNKYVIFMFYVGMNAVVFSAGSHYSAFASTSLICIIVIYFDNKTQKLISQSFKREEELIRDLEKLTHAIHKLSEKEQTKLRKIYNSL